THKVEGQVDETNYIITKPMQGVIDEARRCTLVTCITVTALHVCGRSNCRGTGRKITPRGSPRAEQPRRRWTSGCGWCGGAGSTVPGNHPRATRRTRTGASCRPSTSWCGWHSASTGSSATASTVSCATCSAWLPSNSRTTTLTLYRDWLKSTVIYDWRDLPFREIWAVDTEFYPGPGKANGGGGGEAPPPRLPGVRGGRRGRVVGARG